MGLVGYPSRVTLLIAVMYRPGCPIEEVRGILSERFGPVGGSYGPVPFTFTRYYEDEMGQDPLKCYLAFTRPMDRETLPAIKVFTNGLERRYLRGGKRTINLDPGYIARDKLVLASTKDFYHRLYLSEGIYAEVTLHFRKGGFRFFSWTYPDYKEAGFLEFATRLRAALVHELRNHSGEVAENGVQAEGP
jgi:hypothetical protein